ncbi:MAG TPA: hypothetical protein VFQ30_16040 [Ktedonobacteraceae bacterium]|nr:hypothetical protein [Ktedonobacteraceae bacterium]
MGRVRQATREGMALLYTAHPPAKPLYSRAIPWRVACPELILTSRWLISSLFVLAFTLLSLCALPGTAYASGNSTYPAHTETLMAGPYIIDVNLYQDPPMTDQADEVTVVPHQSGLRLSGSMFMVPGLGTDAVKLHAPLSSLGRSATLVGTIRMPVRGAWNIVVQLDGPRGAGQASFPITVAAPGAMPIWLGWLIALTPLLGIAWMVWHQRRYRLRLLGQREKERKSV